MEPGGNLVYFSNRQEREGEGKQLSLWHSLCVPGQPFGSLIPTTWI